MAAELISLQPNATANIPWKMALIGASTVAVSLAGLPYGVQASPVYTPPIGLTAGDHFRLIFMSVHWIEGSSTDIATYNAFANAEAALNPLLPSTNWFAVASTRAVNAIDNVACAGACATAPIYTVLGNQIVASTAALFAGAASALSSDQFGDSITSYGWSGSTPAGLSSDQTGGALGEATPNLARPIFGGGAVVGLNPYLWGPNTTGEPVIAISADLTVGSVNAPEPASTAVLAAGATVLAFARRRRRVRAN